MFLIQFVFAMLMLITEILLLLTAVSLFSIQMTRVNFKYSWLLAAAGATAAFASVFLWRIHFPQSFSLPPWKPLEIISFTPFWLGDRVSWSLSLSMCALCAAVIWTSVVRIENDPISWAGSLFLVALGLLAVSAGNMLTLIFVWTVIDFFEIVMFLRNARNDRDVFNVVMAFAIRILGSSLVVWPFLVNSSQGSPSDFVNLSGSSAIYLLIAAGLRLVAFPLQLSYKKENLLQRGFGTTFRIVSAISICVLLARIPSFSSFSGFSVILLLVAVLTGLYSGWMWLQSSDEILGRPFWIQGLASLSFAECLLGNPDGALRWGVAIILCGGLLLLFSARRRTVLWLPAMGIWGLSALPFSITASAWKAGDLAHTLFIILLLPIQILLISGYFRHALQPGETSLESQAKWVKIIYPGGLFLIGFTILFLGLDDLMGGRMEGLWWLAIIILIFSSLLFFINSRHLLKVPYTIPERWSQIFQTDNLQQILNKADGFIGTIPRIFTSTLEGDGGLLWSFLLLVLIISVLSTQGFK